MSDSDNTQEPSDTPQEEQQAPQEEQAPVPTSAKAKRKPRQPKEPKQPKESKRKSKVISVDVGHTEYFDDPKTPSEDLPDTEQPPPEVIGPPPPPALVRQPSSVDAKPKAKSRAKAKAKIVLEHIAEAETVAEPVVEPVAEPVKMKTRKPVNKQPKPASEDAPPVAVPDLEDLVMKRMKAMRDAKELKKKEQIQALIAQAI